MYSEVLLLRSKTDDDAVVRLQSNAILRGLAQVSDIPVRIVSPVLAKQSDVELRNGACLLFHYDDLPAARLARSLAGKAENLSLGCFASDIYMFDQYLEVHDIVDFYLAPTRLHRLILMSQLYKPVYLLPESLDPSAMEDGRWLSAFPTKRGRRLLWFGYPESFEKSMVSLVPILQLREEAGDIDSFTLISSRKQFDNRFQLEITPYRKESFSRDAAGFDYCVLSHLSLDLALNSYIKSPNKLITALFLGVIPLASRTPAYEDVLIEFGLERFLFDSPADLNEKLMGLDPLEDSRFLQSSGILDALRERYSDGSIATDFLRIASAVKQRDPALDLTMEPGKLQRKTPEVQIKDHLHDLVPSIQRAYQWRMRRR